MSSLGLVVEGGGVRAIYAAGVLDVLHDACLPFDGVIGVSAGAIHGCSFVSGQKGRSLGIYKRFCKDKRFFSFRTLFRTGDIVDAKFCYHDIPSVHFPYDDTAFAASPMRFYVTCSNLETGRAEYLHLTDMREQIDALRASASLPYVSRIVRYRGMKLLDGGCIDPIPIKAFQALGYTHNVLVLTQPAGHNKKDRDAALAKLFYRRYPAFCKAFERCPAHYQEILRYIEMQEREGKVFVIRPEQAIPVGRLSRDRNKIQLAYDLGRRDALNRLAALDEWLAGIGKT
ncbi:MAG: patatin family protein [Duodenibacillus sp.]|nr:patatin family protein [Duodenibacillus sp.]